MDVLEFEWPCCSQRFIVLSSVATTRRVVYLGRVEKRGDYMREGMAVIKPPRTTAGEWAWLIYCTHERRTTPPAVLQKWRSPSQIYLLSLVANIHFVSIHTGLLSITTLRSRLLRATTIHWLIAQRVYGVVVFDSLNYKMPCCRRENRAMPL